MEDNKKVANLLTLIGLDNYGILHSLFAPRPVNEQSYENLVKKLKDHFDPNPLVIGQRFMFYQRHQKEKESMSEFEAALCIGEFLHQTLRDCFVCEMGNKYIQKELLKLDDFTFMRAHEIAVGMKAAEKNSIDIVNNQYSGVQQASSTVTVAAEFMQSETANFMKQNATSVVR